MNIRHILTPTDFSAHSAQAMTYAFELAQRVDAKLSLLHQTRHTSFWLSTIQKPYAEGPRV